MACLTMIPHQITIIIAICASERASEKEIGKTIAMQPLDGPLIYAMLDLDILKSQFKICLMFICANYISTLPW